MVLLTLWLSSGLSANLPEGFIEQVILENIDPVGLAITPDGRVLVAEKNGIIRIIYDGVLQPDPFLQVNADNYNERGLQNIILDPDFEFNNYLYVFYTTPAGHNRVSRFTASGNFALPGSETVLFESDHINNGSIHNGGSMAIKDGQLYIGIGEVGYPDNSSNMNNTLGKVSRINLDGSIPEDNPYYHTLNGNNRAIYAYGFRNPFSMDIHPITGQIMVNDVGGGKYEEVNLLKPGKNYGWPAIEGYPESWQTEPADHEPPFYAYTHDDGRCAIVGAAFYQPDLPSFPEQYWGKYFFGEYCSGEMFFLNPEDGSVQTFGTNFNRLVAIRVAEDGQIYYLQRAGVGDGSIGDNTSTNQGSLVLISYSGSGAPFISRQPRNQTIVVGEDAEFTVYGAGKAPLSYEWKVNGNIVGGDSARLVISNTDMSMNNASVVVTISNEVEAVSSHPAVLTVVNNTRPVPVIELPTGMDKYAAGSTIYMKGGASDAEDGELGSDRLSWHIDFHHDTHTHPAMLSTSGKELTYEIPRIGETSDNVWYRVYLKATDSHGFSQTSFVNVYPQKSQFTIQTIPPGSPVKLEGKEINKDTTVTSVVGITRVLNADKHTIKGDNIYTFENWGPESRMPIYLFDVIEKDTTYTAHFSVRPLGQGDGLNTYYYNNEYKFHNHLPDIATKGNINFNWGPDSPEGMPADKFYARFDGWILPVFSGDYIFYAAHDDGVRLSVNYEELFDDWTDYAVREHSGTIYLEEDVFYPITLEFYENEGDAIIELYWSATYLPKEIIPVRQLYSTEIVTSIPENGAETLHLYPNPCETLLRIKSIENDWDHILIKNYAGVTVAEFPGSVVNIPLNVSNLHTGFYILEARNAHTTSRKKFFKK